MTQEPSPQQPILHQRARHETVVFGRLRTDQDRVADAITRFAGSMSFVYLHVGWFAVWIVLNAGLVGSAVVFDHFPFGLLTMIVSLEAIFLSTFVMVTQNRQAERSDVRSQLDFETNLRSEIWSVHIGAALGVDVEHVESVIEQALEGARGHLAGAGRRAS